jgi:hypothetical protein
VVGGADQADKAKEDEADGVSFTEVRFLSAQSAPPNHIVMRDV